MTIRRLLTLAVFASASAASASAETALERGTYLMNSIAACGNCHTPLDANGPIAGQELAGRLVDDGEPFTAYAPNITPDMETGIGSWTDDEIITAIREGKRPDGTIIGPPMPIGLYRGLSDTDVEAMVAYLRQVPAVRNEVPKSTYRIPLPESYGPPVGSVADVEPGVTVEYGGYLAGPVGHCIECHTPMGQGHPDFENQLGAGGFEFRGPWGVSASANVTSHETDGVASYSDDELIAMITTGVHPDGSKMLPPMGYGYYANMQPDDVKAIIAYLRTLPPKPNPK
ncbi:MAG: c-type cytochrome [Hyphomicrobiales bacterium]|nr:c-type cytochrome [Hyphomicrobiales bacterium]